MSKFASRKLWVAVGSVIVVIVAQLGFPEAAAQQIVDALIPVIVVYLGGQSIVDAIPKKS
jgi:hypothetical protein